MTTALSLEAYTGKKVFIIIDDAASEAQKGLVIQGAPHGLIFKPYGKSSHELIAGDRVKHIELQDEEVKELKATRVNPLTLDRAKRHLVDRHGYNLADVNAYSPEQALAFHETIDHSPLGHFHAEAPAKAKESEEAQPSES